MSAQSIEPHYSTPLLALVSAIMDFPAPQTATSDDYDALIQQIDQLCPLQHFGMLGLSDTGLNWLYAYKVSDIFKQQLGREQSRITDQLTQRLLQVKRCRHGALTNCSWPSAWVVG